ncbi:hypothetical protein IFM89_007602, partial [Coptis chinensis]
MTAEALGIKSSLIPAFLDPNLKKEDLLTGVSFASSASGYDNLTAGPHVTSKGCCGSGTIEFGATCTGQIPWTKWRRKLEVASKEVGEIEVVDGRRRR